jgi:hypothetical protein
MINLDNVTLLCVDCIHPQLALKAIDISTRGINFGKIKLITDVSNRTIGSSVNINNLFVYTTGLVTDIRTYSKFIINNLINYIDTDYCLIIQYDGYVLNPSAWDYRFLDYDYIGAPWWDRVVGNGGFSLRSKKFLEATSKLGIKDINSGEDDILCRQYRSILENMSIRFAPYELASKFSIEYCGPNGYKWNGEFGFHDFRTDISAAIK